MMYRLLLLLCLLPLWGAGQLRLFDAETAELLLRSERRDSLGRLQQLRDWQLEYIARGYLTASVLLPAPDSAVVYAGQRYRWRELTADSSLSGDWQRAINFRSRDYRGKPINPSAYAAQLRRLLGHAENNGFPFASVQLLGLEMDSNTLAGRLAVNRGPLIRYGRIRIEGDAPIKDRWLERYLGLVPGAVYSQKQIDAVGRQLRALPFLVEQSPAQQYFFNEQSELYLFLSRRRVNSFEGMLGLFPNTAGNRVTLMGDLNLQLYSVLRQGEQLGFQFRSLQAGTQDLRIRLSWPFLFRSPLGAEGEFQLFRRDSTFLELKARLALPYHLGGADWLRAYTEQSRYSLLRAQPLPGLGGVSGSLFGLEYQRFRLDRAVDPLEGYRYRIGFGAGNRVRAATAEQPEFRSAQWIATAEAEGYWRWSPRWVLAAEGQLRWWESDSIYTNELARLGGFRTLKGFDEASILASAYLWFNVEQRFLLDQTSWLYLFYNAAILKNAALGQAYSDRPFGFGAGLSFRNRGGVFSVAYALGSERGNPIQLRSAKVHLGYRYLL